MPLIIATTIIVNVSSNQARMALQNSAQNQLLSIRETKKGQIEDYFANIKNQVLTYANDRMIIEAMSEFQQAFNEVPFDISKNDLSRQLSSYYQQQFAVQFSVQNDGETVDSRRLYADLDLTTLYWQNEFIQKNNNPLGSKHLLNSNQDGSAYSNIHANYHPHIRDYLEKFEYYDIFLVEPNKGQIVYSVFKELDYGTSLLDGPYAATGIAQAFKQAKSLSAGQSVLIDFQPYLPSYNAQASFIAAPIYDKRQMLGVLIFQMPIGRINQIMTSDAKWGDIGLGQSGETYLVGSDLKARSMSRFLIEDKSAYLELLNNLGVDANTVKAIDSKDSNIGLQSINTQGTNAALAGETGFDIFADYRNISVLSAYAPVNIAGLNWALMSEIDEQEAFASASELVDTIWQTSLILMVVMAMLSLLIGFLFSKNITKPIVQFSELMQKVEKSDDLSLRSDLHSKDEIGQMAYSFNSMLTKFETLIKTVSTSIHQVNQATQSI